MLENQLTSGWPFWMRYVVESVHLSIHRTPQTSHESSFLSRAPEWPNQTMEENAPPGLGLGVIGIHQGFLSLADAPLPARPSSFAFALQSYGRAVLPRRMGRGN